MSEMVLIKNNNIDVTIRTLSAEMTSIKKDGVEILWEGDENIWARQAPVLFPICGALRDNKYIYNGKSYFLEKHGYARASEFLLEEKKENEAVFLLKSNEESRKKFPFEYELRIKYTLEDNLIKIRYIIDNKDTKDMYFSIGSHESYACPDGIEEYTLLFEENENLNTTLVDGSCLVYEEKLIKSNTKELSLKREYFEPDALVFLDLKSRKVELMHNKSGRRIAIEFNGFDSLIIWTVPGAKFVCVEPWAGMPDFVDSDYDFTRKKGIIKLSEGESIEKEHTITL